MKKLPIMVLVLFVEIKPHEHGDRMATGSGELCNRWL